MIAESGWLQNDCVFVSRNLHKWAKDEKAEDIDLTFKFMNPKIRKDPLGCVLVIGCVYSAFHSPLGRGLIMPFAAKQSFQLPIPIDPGAGDRSYCRWKHCRYQA